MARWRDELDRLTPKLTPKLTPSQERAFSRAAAELGLPGHQAEELGARLEHLKARAQQLGRPLTADEGFEMLDGSPIEDILTDALDEALGDEEPPT